MKRYLKIFIVAVLTFGILSVGTVLVADFIVMPAYTRHGQEVRVPDVRGMTLSVAKKVLVKNGLIPVVKGYRSYPAPPQTVVEQYPEAGKIVKVGRRIELTLAE